MIYYLPISSNFVNTILFCEGYQLWSSPFCNFLGPIDPWHLASNTTPCSQMSAICVLFGWETKFWHPHKTCKFTVMYALIFIFLDRKREDKRFSTEQQQALPKCNFYCNSNKYVIEIHMVVPPCCWTWHPILPSLQNKKWTCFSHPHQSWPIFGFIPFPVHRGTINWANNLHFIYIYGYDTFPVGILKLMNVGCTVGIFLMTDTDFHFVSFIY